MREILGKNVRSAALPATALTLLLVLCSVAPAQIYSDLYNFNGTSGSSPSDPQVLAQGRDGNLYGTAREEGSAGGGTAFSVTPYGVLNVIHNFSGSDGWGPYAGLTLGLDGNFYGTTFLGGSNNLGEVFQLTPDGFVLVLHSFSGGTDGAYPFAPPILGNDGSLYGLTKYATAYKVTTSGTFTPLGTIPGQSSAPLILGTDGNFYGTTQYGGTFNQGTVFRMTPAGVVNVIYNFDTTRGGVPWGGVVQAGGNFYGTTTGGGSGGGGVVYRLTPSGNFTVIHNFPVGSADDGDDGLQVCSLAPTACSMVPPFTVEATDTAPSSKSMRADSITQSSISSTTLPAPIPSRIWFSTPMAQPMAWLWRGDLWAMACSSAWTCTLAPKSERCCPRAWWEVWWRF
jgi:uncharacterized repeat protein (TIGR03803 family)